MNFELILDPNLPPNTVELRSSRDVVRIINIGAPVKTIKLTKIDGSEEDVPIDDIGPFGEEAGSTMVRFKSLNPPIQVVETPARIRELLEAAERG